MIANGVCERYKFEIVILGKWVSQGIGFDCHRTCPCYFMKMITNGVCERYKFEFVMLGKVIIMENRAFIIIESAHALHEKKRSTYQWKPSSYYSRTRSFTGCRRVFWVIIKKVLSVTLEWYFSITSETDWSAASASIPCVRL